MKEDLQHITAEYLISNIELAFQVWNDKPWGKYISFDTFCEDILGGYQDPTEIDPYWWGRIETTRLDQQGAYDYYHHYSQSGTIQSAIIGVASIFASKPVGTAIAIGMTYISYQEAEALYQAVRDGESWKIIGSSRSTYVYDSHGNSIFSIIGDMY